MAIRLTLFLISAVVFCGANGSLTTFTPLPPQQDIPVTNTFSNIDTLRELYFNLDKALWRVIRAGQGQEYVLQRIHSVHLRFFNENFNENGVELDLFDPDQSALHNEIKHINSTVNSIRDVYLQTKINDAQRDQVLGFSRNIVNMTKTMDIMHNLTSNNDFFGYIKRVSECVIEFLIGRFLRHQKKNSIKFQFSIQFFRIFFAER